MSCVVVRCWLCVQCCCCCSYRRHCRCHLLVCLLLVWVQVCSCCLGFWWTNIVCQIGAVDFVNFRCSSSMFFSVSHLNTYMHGNIRNCNVFWFRGPLLSCFKGSLNTPGLFCWGCCLFCFHSSVLICNVWMSVCYVKIAGFMFIFSIAFFCRWLSVRLCTVTCLFSLFVGECTWSRDEARSWCLFRSPERRCFSAP